MPHRSAGLSRRDDRHPRVSRAERARNFRDLRDHDDDRGGLRRPSPLLRSGQCRGAVCLLRHRVGDTRRSCTRAATTGGARGGTRDPRDPVHFRLVCARPRRLCDRRRLVAGWRGGPGLHREHDGLAAPLRGHDVCDADSVSRVESGTRCAIDRIAAAGFPARCRARAPPPAAGQRDDPHIARRDRQDIGRRRLCGDRDAKRALHVHPVAGALRRHAFAGAPSCPPLASRPARRDRADRACGQRASATSSREPGCGHHQPGSLHGKMAGMRAGRGRDGG